jgi:hypothetical protein
LTSEPPREKGVAASSDIFPMQMYPLCTFAPFPVPDNEFSLPGRPSKKDFYKKPLS